MHLKITKRAEWDIDHRAAFWEARSRGLGRDYILHLQDELKCLSELTKSACAFAMVKQSDKKLFAASAKEMQVSDYNAQSLPTRYWPLQW